MMYRNTGTKTRLDRYLSVLGHTEIHRTRKSNSSSSNKRHHSVATKNRGRSTIKLQSRLNQDLNVLNRRKSAFPRKGNILCFDE